jgi:hypothetical protein
MKKIIILSSFFILNYSCQNSNESNALGGIVDDEKEYNELMSKDSIIEYKTSNEDLSISELIQYTNHFIDVLHKNNLEDLATYFHPEKGTYISPYTLIDSSTIKYFKTSFIEDLNSNKELIWGTYDGNGEVIKLPIRAYFKQFVYNVDYKLETTEIHTEQDSLTFSNTINNVSQVLPNAKFVEYFYKGSEKYEGMDWSSLIFYVEPYQNQLYLVAIVHNQWTI